MAKKYTQDGVDVKAGDDFSAFAGNVCRQSFGDSPYVEVVDLSSGHFRGPRGFKFVNLPDGCCQTIASDGIGTKVVIITEAMSHKMAGRDLLAMTCGDITRWGGMPLVFASVLDVKTLGKEGDATNNAYREMMSGLGSAAKGLNLVILTGETAELGDCVSSENSEGLTQFNWAGFATGVYHPDKMILGNTLKAGQVVIALKESGFRSNGISSVRKALALQYGEKWWKNPEAANDIFRAATPSVLYDQLLMAANGWIEGFEKIPMHLIVHVTGGAIKSKLAEDILFPLGLSAELDNLFYPPSIMFSCARWRNMEDEECYETWNGGQSCLVVVDESEAKGFIDLAGMFSVEAQICGRITTAYKPRVVLNSRFLDKEVVYTLKES